jgi:hypothetical protein
MPSIFGEITPVVVLNDDEKDDWGWFWGEVVRLMLG